MPIEWLALEWLRRQVHHQGRDTHLQIHRHLVQRFARKAERDTRRLDLRRIRDLIVGDDVCRVIVSNRHDDVVHVDVLVVRVLQVRILRDHVRVHERVLPPVVPHRLEHVIITELNLVEERPTECHEHTPMSRPPSRPRINLRGGRCSDGGATAWARVLGACC